MLQLVTIDCWDTILQNDGLWDSRLERLALEFFTTVQPSLSFSRLSAAYRRESEDFSKTIVESHMTKTLEMRLAYLAELAGVTLAYDRMEEMKTQLEAAILDPLPEVVPGAREFLQKIRQLDIGLCLISNTGWFSSRAITSALRARDIAPFFQHMIFSDVFGLAKPAKEIFEHALHLFACQANQALHIGNQVEIDVKGAKNAGYHVILFGATDNPKSDQIENKLSASSYEGAFRLILRQRKIKDGV